MIDHNVESVSELAEKTGINRNTMGDIINQKYRPSTQTMDKLIEFFGWSPQQAGEIFFASELSE